MKHVYMDNRSAKNGQKAIMHENHRCTTLQQSWCDFCGGKGHEKNSCWHAMKSKPKQDKYIPNNVNIARYVNPRYKNHANKPKHADYMLKNVDTTRYTILKYENHAAKSTPPKPLPKSGRAIMTKKVKMLITKEINYDIQVQT